MYHTCCSSYVKVKAKAQILADMEEFYKRRLIEDDTLKAEIDDLMEDINKYEYIFLSN